MKDQSKFAKKNLGQNFLTSTQVRDDILAEAGDLKNKKVLEIGPGLGFLTEKLLEASADLTAIELDERAFKILQNKFGNFPNFRLLNDDILQTNLDELFESEDYRVIANIPYNITAPIIRKLLEKTKNKPEFALLMVQKEVAQKICDPVNQKNTVEADESGEGQPFGVPLRGVAVATQKRAKSKRSILSVAVEVYAEAKYCFTVTREHFEPSPKVDSAIMKLTVLEKPLITPEQQRDFFTVVNAGFSEKRKKIGNVLGRFFGIPSKDLLGDIDENRRAETLSIDEWLYITEKFTNVKQ
ncbi:16S rRNA (adenine(1518)-N(6)/adenine(1519)-N(6))-dimethyltransferase [bacterium]|nr:16S rRNA (adenine(1518)-N(6)/adenine(1519)-N(6))-dimethyltransferase [bacterium]NCQ55398.1 16S rRNA (adenine(1518)-N(6)/adenine(1519)-N(6))-dimethyltransferase [Candidatus Parcubacteria bacterium]NCS67760.1 16S rRNA (adenine(1518)-N(6)/adenine(1519)-N(6))-dimethyltransferase [Candidatus Peregrinibacteria bacterium]NCS96426.1 16S rRNA (adenine(1518)-N(6)/adenine(1519)-N(6))-dimethyltransferase [bacterium]